MEPPSRIVLLFEANDLRNVEKSVLPLFPATENVEPQAVTKCAWPQLPPGTRVAAYLNDEALASLLPSAAKGGWIVGLLPHPGLWHGGIGFGIAQTLDAALSDMLEQPDGIAVDILYCNGLPVLNSVVVADGMSLFATNGDARLRARLVRFGRHFGKLGLMRLRPFTLTTHKERVLDTAALGVVVVQHGRSSVLARRVLADSSVNDGMLHALVMAPRSLSETARYMLASLMLQGTARRLPTYVGHIKTETLRISSNKPLEFSHDSHTICADQIEFHMDRRALRMCLGRHLEREERGLEAKEIVKVQGLPTGDAKLALTASSLPLIAHAGTDEFRDLFLLLRENSRASETYITLMVLSTLLACFGLFANSSPVIIGAMVLAPLMSPIVSLAMGVLRQDGALIIGSGRTLAIGTGVSLICSTLLTAASPLMVVNQEIAARLTPTLLDLGIAVVSGVAGAYAHARSEVARSLAGVAIAVALVPPLAVAGIGIGWADWRVFEGSFLLFLTNLGGITLAAAVTFLVLGYSPFHRARRGLLMSLALVGLVSVPLAVGFGRMVEEHRIIDRIDELEINGVMVDVVQVTAGDPTLISVRLLAQAPLDPGTIDAVKAALEARLERPITVEAVVTLVR